MHYDLNVRSTDINAIKNALPHEFRDFFESAEFAGWQLDGRYRVVHVVETSFVLALLDDVLGEVDAWIFALNL